MDDNVRLGATAIIWGSFTLIVGGIITALALTGAELNTGAMIFLGIILVLLILAVTEATSAVWGRKSEDDERVRRSKGKRNRPSRVQRLIEGLDDDEVYELESLLLAREDEDMVRSARR